MTEPVSIGADSEPTSHLAYGRIVGDGLWWNNPGLAQLLGLCPLLAVSRTFVTAFGLAVSTVLVLTATNGMVALFRRGIDARVRLPSLILIIAACVTAVDLLFKATWFDLYLDVGLFIPLIVTNCVILARAESFASRSPVLPALVDGLAHGLGFAVLLLVLGGVREVLGYGTLGAGIGQLVASAPVAELGTGLRILPIERGLLIALLPPGAFFLLALLVALRNARLARRGRTTA